MEAHCKVHGFFFI